MNSAANNNLIAIKLISCISIKKYFKICVSLPYFFVLLLPITQTIAVRKILFQIWNLHRKILHLFKEKTLILVNVHKVKFKKKIGIYTEKCR